MIILDFSIVIDLPIDGGIGSIKSYLIVVLSTVVVDIILLLLLLKRKKKKENQHPHTMIFKINVIKK